MTKNLSLENIGLWKNLTAKHFTKDILQLTGMEVSCNRLPAHTGVPFVHVHKKNEELYIVVSGNGKFFVDGEEFPVAEGSLIRVAPGAERTLTAGSEDLCFICVQAEAGSLHQYTKEDANLTPTKASWMK